MAKSASKKASSKTRAKALPKKLPQPSKDVHLGDDGYSVRKSSSARRNALKKASSKHGSLTVLKRLNLIRNLSKNNSKNKKRLSEDVEYMKRKYKREKNKK